jgi:outer membrane protein
LEFEATRRRESAEKGIFEPSLVLGATREENMRQLTSERLVNIGRPGVTNFSEQNNRYNSALEFLVPTGARLRLGSTLSDIRNNFQQLNQLSIFTNSEYESFVGASLVQPLLKNFGPRATLANLRIAAQQSEIAWQDYRKQLSQTLAGAEAGYWGLYLAQEQLRFFDESVKVADTVLADARARNAAGKAAEIDILQAEADLAMRRNGRSEAVQKLGEARSRVAGFIDTTPFDARGMVVAEAPPAIVDRKLEFLEHWNWVFSQNPDFSAQKARLQQEGIRVAFAKNQALPQLDLKSSYGLNGLGRSPGESFDQYSNQYESWSIGLELRVPLGGGIKERNELAATRARKQAAILVLKELETTLRNTLNVTLEKVRHARMAIQDYEATVRLQENLLKTELARLEVGRVEARKVLEVERDLLQSRLSALAAQITYQQSVLELDVLSGTYLPRRNLSMSRVEVAQRTQSILMRTSEASGAAR